MSILSEKTAGFAAARWEARLPLLKKAPELMALHARLAGEAKELLTYLMATLPVQDLADTPAALWQEAVERPCWPGRPGPGARPGQSTCFCCTSSAPG